MMFWIAAVAMIAIALAFLVPPLLRKTASTGPGRDDVNIAVYQRRLAELEADLNNDTLSREQFEQARNELERELLQDLPAGGDDPAPAGTASRRWPVVAVGVLVPLLAIGLYLPLGGLHLLDQPPEAARNTASIETMVSKLAERLARNPDDGKGWMMLGRSYLVLKRYPEAGLAYAKAYELLGDDPELLTAYAEVLAITNNEDLRGKPTELINKALAKQPDHPQALWLAGHAANQRGDRAAALKYWQHLLALLPSESQDARTVRRVIDNLKAGGGQGNAPAPAAKTASLKVRVELDPGLRDRVSPDDTVFVFARLPQGPKMPLAIVKKQAKDLPLTVTLDDSMAMVPDMKLSNFPRVIIGARVAKGGTATKQSGDLQGLSTPTATTRKQTVVVKISQVVP